MLGATLTLLLLACCSALQLPPALKNADNYQRGALAAGRAARARVAPREAFGRFFGKKSAESSPDAVDGVGSEQS